MEGYEWNGGMKRVGTEGYYKGMAGRVEMDGCKGRNDRVAMEGHKGRKLTNLHDRVQNHKPTVSSNIFYSTCLCAMSLSKGAG